MLIRNSTRQISVRSSVALGGICFFQPAKDGGPGFRAPVPICGSSSSVVASSFLSCSIAFSLVLHVRFLLVLLLFLLFLRSFALQKSAVPGWELFHLS